MGVILVFKTKKIIPILLTALMLIGVIVLTAFATTPYASFEAVVDDIKNATSLTEKEQLLESADAQWDAYLDSVGGQPDAAAIEAYASYESMKEQILQIAEKCTEFIGYVTEAENGWLGVDYELTKASLNAAGALIDEIDMSYEGISSAKTRYDSVLKEVEDCEKPYRLYIQAIEAALAADNYKAMKQAMNEVATREKEISALSIKLPTYPGYGQAVAAKAEIADEMAAIMENAAAFINAVQLINGDNIKAGIAEAYELYDAIDQTADGVSAAKSQLDSLNKTYGGAVIESSEAIDDMSKLIFSCLLW